jgi:glyoxylase-like metal-dependent hydrolase (beta-lactamase superfamily II)
MATVRRVVAPNPGPYTGPGTNTWIVDAGPVVVVIDPGPDDDRHMSALLRALGRPVGAVLVTHSHADHRGLAERFAERVGARIIHHPELADNDVVRVGSLALVGLHTPGHARDHLCFWMAEDRVLFTGDLVLGRGSSMVAYPEGDVAEYVRSLERVGRLEPRLLFPGHWDPVTEGAKERIEGYRQHRLERERQLVEELERGGPGTATELTHRVYAAELAGQDGAGELWRAAEMTLRAHLRKLVDEGRVSESEGRFERIP